MTHSLVDTGAACLLGGPERQRWVGALVFLGALLAGCAASTELAESVAESTTTMASIATASTTTAVPTTTTEPPPAVTVGAEVLADRGFDLLEGKRVGVIANQTSLVRGQHLIDVLHAAPNLELVAVFAPEHGVRGTAGAGDLIDDEVDSTTGVTIFSLYGETRTPTPEMLAGIDVLVYDLQDVGGRFYTYVSTMGLAMQAAAAAEIEFVVLDRPDPSGGVIAAGYILEEDQRSFIGQYPVPAAYAMTAGELALAIVAEGWLEGLDALGLTVVEMQGWRRGMTWEETGLTWVPPSPGLQTAASAVTYLGTVLFEATSISYGGGTLETFEVVGAEWADEIAVSAHLNGHQLPGVVFVPVIFTPGPLPERTDNPRLNGIEMRGVQIKVTDPRLFEPVGTAIYVLEEFARAHSEAAVLFEPPADNEAATFEPFVNREQAMGLLAGTDALVAALEAGVRAEEIVASWAADLQDFDQLRLQYLLY
ncbi:MAG: exo-beta-N-acetylmuramidase NamZ family protein [Acidimicrobiales bacterium]|jgi:uncharacterized protein YbbC (DUF1343 family)